MNGSPSGDHGDTGSKDRRRRLCGSGGNGITGEKVKGTKICEYDGDDTASSSGGPSTVAYAEGCRGQRRYADYSIVITKRVGRNSSLSSDGLTATDPPLRFRLVTP